MIETTFFNFEFQALDLEMEIQDLLRDLDTTKQTPEKIQSITDKYKRLLRLKVSHYNDFKAQYEDEYSIKTKIDIFILSRRILSFIRLALSILSTDHIDHKSITDQMTYLYYDTIDIFVQVGTQLEALYADLELDFMLKDELKYYSAIIESTKI